MHLALAMPKDFPWKSKFNQEIKRLHDWGYMKRWKKVTKHLQINHEKYMDIAGVLEFSTEVLFTSAVAGRVFTSIWETRN